MRPQCACGSKPVSHKTENSPQIGFSVIIIRFQVLYWECDWLIIFVSQVWPIGLFWVTFAISYKSTSEFLLQLLSLSLNHIKARSVCHNREPLCSVVITTDAPSLLPLFPFFLWPFFSLDSFSLAFSCLSVCLSVIPSVQFIHQLQLFFTALSPESWTLEKQMLILL